MNGRTQEKIDPKRWYRCPDQRDGLYSRLFGRSVARGQRFKGNASVHPAQCPGPAKRQVAAVTEGQKNDANPPQMWKNLNFPQNGCRSFSSNVPCRPESYRRSDWGLLSESEGWLPTTKVLDSYRVETGRAHPHDREIRCLRQGQYQGMGPLKTGRWMVLCAVGISLRACRGSKHGSQPTRPGTADSGQQGF